MACMQHSVLPCKFKSSACSHLRAAGVPSKSRAAMQMNAAAAARGPPSPSPSELIPPVFSRLSAPVYSLSTSSQLPTNSRATLNLVTYAAPVSIKPRRFVIGLYLGTLSHENFRETGHGVLQVLRQRHAPLFALLGKTSGRDVDKLAEIRKAGFQVDEHSGLPMLADAACWIELKAASEFIPCGDHDVVICDVVSYINPESESLDEVASDALYTSHLRQLGYMT